MNGMEAVFKQFMALAWLAGYFSASAAGGDNPTPTKAADVDDHLAGKVILATVKGPPEWAFLLDDVQTRKLGDRTFVVGTVADEGSGRNQWVGRTVWLSPEQLVRIFEFKSVKEAREAYREHFNQQIPPAREAPPAVPATGLREVEDRSFFLPIQVDASRKPLIKRIVIYSSRDEGKIWERFTDISPEETRVRFEAAGEGLYWFAVQTVAPDGTKEPSGVGRLTPVMKIFVKEKHDGKIPPPPGPAAQEKTQE
jgi:hypothetical protein